MINCEHCGTTEQVQHYPFVVEGHVTHCEGAELIPLPPEWYQAHEIPAPKASQEACSLKFVTRQLCLSCFKDSDNE